MEQSKYTFAFFHHTGPLPAPTLELESPVGLNLQICAWLCKTLRPGAADGFPLSLEEVLVDSASVTGRRVPTGTQSKSASSAFT